MCSRSSAREHELAREASVYIAVLASGTPQDFSEWVGAQTSAARYQQLFANTATPAELFAYQDVMGSKAASAALPTEFPTATVTPAAYYDQYQQQTRKLDRAVNAVERVVNDAAATQASAALRDTRLYGGAAVFAMLLTLMLIWFVSRAVVGPVRRLTAAAREMSQRQLPALVESLRTGGDIGDVQPTRIEVTSEDEIGELAQAFNDVEAVTIEVADEQSRLLRKGMADLFVNLARRNQSLLERQLELLDELERNEHDPAALDALFKLDHMATRMRRNAESLLVLSGAEQPRQWQQPIALLDVVRAAAAEIADFPASSWWASTATSPSRVVPSPTWPTSSPSCSRTRRRSRRPTPRSSCRARPPRAASCSRSPTRGSACRRTGSWRPTHCWPPRRWWAWRCPVPSGSTWSAPSPPATASRSSCVRGRPSAWWRW